MPHTYADGDAKHFIRVWATDEDGVWTIGGGGTPGALDDAFAGGKVTSDLGYGEFVRDVAVQEDGKVVAIAYGATGYFEVLRYETDGTLDSDFSSDGRTEYAYDDSSIRIQQTVTQDAGHPCSRRR